MGSLPGPGCVPEGPAEVSGLGTCRPTASPGAVCCSENLVFTRSTASVAAVGFTVRVVMVVTSESSVTFLPHHHPCPAMPRARAGVCRIADFAGSLVRRDSCIRGPGPSHVGLRL